MQKNIVARGSMVALGVACGLVLVAIAGEAPVPQAQANAVARVRLFILSGQSNMAGLNPDVSFTPALTNAFPKDDVIVVKEAVNGQPIRKWYKQWKPAPGQAMPPGGGIGQLYDQLVTKVRDAIQSKARPDSVVFVWMQGEADAKGYGSVYEESLRGVIKQLRDDLKRPDMGVVIGRISDFGNSDTNRPDWNLIRRVQVKIAESDPLAAWVDTDDLNGPANGLHYDRQGYATLGSRFAARAIELIRRNDNRAK